MSETSSEHPPSGRAESPAAAARSLGLRYVTSRALVLRRRRCGRGFCYVRADGRVVKDPALIGRARDLVIPPAWTEVRIAGDASAHIQAMGVDQAGRRQYIYHPRWQELRELRKARRLVTFAQVLSEVRIGIRRDLRAPTGSRRLALAVGAALIDASAIRIGSERHYRRTGACGAVTLRRSHVRVNGRALQLSFPAKSGKAFSCEIAAPYLLAPLRRLVELPGRRLLAYREDGELCRVSARQLNEYLAGLAGRPISAKDFRTFQGTALAGDLLMALEPAERQVARDRQIAAVMRSVAERLGNTPAVARASYVHALVLACFAAGTLQQRWRRVGRRRPHLEPHEAALARFLAGLAPQIARSRTLESLAGAA